MYRSSRPAPRSGSSEHLLRKGTVHRIDQRDLLTQDQIGVIGRARFVVKVCRENGGIPIDRPTTRYFQQPDRFHRKPPFIFARPRSRRGSGANFRSCRRSRVSGGSRWGSLPLPPVRSRTTAGRSRSPHRLLFWQGKQTVDRSRHNLFVREGFFKQARYGSEFWSGVSIAFRTIFPPVR